MQKPTDSAQASSMQETQVRHDISAEAQSYLHALYQEFHEQTLKYRGLTRELLNLEARVELAEQTVRLTRDHLAAAIERSDSTDPIDWLSIFNQFRFVGVRLAEACLTLLKENRRMTAQELVIGLNQGLFRFRTSSPMREIHAALLRQSSVKKEDQHWVWVESDDETLPKKPILETEDKE